MDVETTQSLNRSLKITNESRVIQIEIQRALDEQGQQINNTRALIHDMRDDLTFSKKLLRYIKLGIFVQCFASNPEFSATSALEPTNFTKTRDRDPISRNDEHPNEDAVLDAIGNTLALIKKDAIIMKRTLDEHNRDLDKLDGETSRVQTQVKDINKNF